MLASIGECYRGFCSVSLFFRLDFCYMTRWLLSRWCILSFAKRLLYRSCETFCFGFFVKIDVIEMNSYFSRQAFTPRRVQHLVTVLSHRPTPNHRLTPNHCPTSNRRRIPLIKRKVLSTLKGREFRSEIPLCLPTNKVSSRKAPFYPGQRRHAAIGSRA